MFSLENRNFGEGVTAAFFPMPARRLFRRWSHRCRAGESETVLINWNREGLDEVQRNNFSL